MTVRPEAIAAAADRLRRSLHFVPGANEKMLHKSLATAADSLVLDLEDAVTPERKDEARGVVADWLRDVDFDGKERTVRMNPLDTPWGIADLERTMEFPPDAYLVPKISTLDELKVIDARLSELEAGYGHEDRSVALLLIATETPLGVLNIATFSECPRVAALSWGAEDLSAAIGGVRNRDDNGEYLEVYKHSRNVTLLSATAAALQPIDTVFVDFRDEDGLRRECQEARWLGFTGKITIHPAQIDIVNAAFSPTAGELDEARRLLQAFEDAQAQGKMAFSFEGTMVDMPHLTRARKIIEKAQKLEAS